MNQKFILVLLTGLCFFTPAVFAMSPTEHHVAVYGCTQAMLDGMMRDFMKRSGQTPGNFTQEERERFVVWLDKEMPGMHDAVKKQCGCVIDILFEEEGRVGAVGEEESEALIRKHRSRIQRECDSMAIAAEEIVKKKKEQRSEYSEPPEDVKITPSREYRSLKPLKIYKKDAE